MPAVDSDMRTFYQQRTPGKPNLQPSYSNPQPSVRSLNKEAVHLPYKSASPDFTDLNVQHASQGLRADSSYTPRYYGRNRLRGFPMAAFYGSELHIFPPLRHRATSEGRYHNNQQQLPQISVVPAHKHSRSYQRPRAVEGFSVPQPVVVKKVEVSLHEVQQTTKRNRPSSEASVENTQNESKPKEPAKNLPKEPATSLPLKSVDLNKGLNVDAAMRKRGSTSSRSNHLETALSSKGEPHVVSLSHLPLKEVYLKPDSSARNEQAVKRDKTIRILRWLEDLKYLDEKAVQRGRCEVERTKFVLPEIKEIAVAYT